MSETTVRVLEELARNPDIGAKAYASLVSTIEKDEVQRAMELRDPAALERALGLTPLVCMVATPDSDGDEPLRSPDEEAPGDGSDDRDAPGRGQPDRPAPSEPDHPLSGGTGPSDN